MNKLITKYFYFILLSGSSLLYSQNYSLSFDGDDGISLTSKPISGVQNQFSILSYFKTNNLSSVQGIYGHGGGYQDLGLIIQQNNGTYQLQFYILTSTSEQGYVHAPIEADVWNFLAATYDGQSMKIYVNGDLIDEIAFNGSLDWNAGSNFFGPNIGGGNDWLPTFNGHLDDISFWTKVLSPEEIINYMVESPSGDEDELASCYNFNEGEGSTLTDLSSNGNNGIINGATWSDDVPLLENDSDYVVGSLGPAGGYVIYDKGSVSDGWRYIEIAPDEWSGDGDPATTWGCSGSEINGADGYALGLGMQNSIDIENGCDGDNAA